MSKRMRLIVEPSGHVEITYLDYYTDEMVTRRFSCPSATETRYVVEHLGSGRTGQVCEEIASTGSTLRSTRQHLPELIRAEYRAMRRAEKRMEAGR